MRCCNTDAGYQRHVRRGEDACDESKAAHNRSASLARDKSPRVLVPLWILGSLLLDARPEHIRLTVDALGLSTVHEARSAA